MPRAIHQEVTLAAEPAEGVYSIVHFELQKDDGGATKLVFDHTGFPQAAHDELVDGWVKMYWEPLKRYLLNFPSRSLPSPASSEDAPMPGARA